MMKKILAAEYQAVVHWKAAKALESEFCKCRDLINEWRTDYHSVMCRLELASAVFKSRAGALWNVRLEAAYSHCIFENFKEYWDYRVMTRAIERYRDMSDKLGRLK